MTRCKYYQNSENIDGDFSLARDGYFMQIGTSNGDSVAIVLDKHTNKMCTTWIDYIQLVETPQDVLRDKVISSVKEFLPVKKHDDIEVAIIQCFEKYGFK